MVSLSLSVPLESTITLAAWPQPCSSTHLLLLCRGARHQTCSRDYVFKPSQSPLQPSDALREGKRPLRDAEGLFLPLRQVLKLSSRVLLAVHTTLQVRHERQCIRYLWP